jgi:hypothetical protein
MGAEGGAVAGRVSRHGGANIFSKNLATDNGGVRVGRGGGSRSAFLKRRKHSDGEGRGEVAEPLDISLEFGHRERGGRGEHVDRRRQLACARSRGVLPCADRLFELCGKVFSAHISIALLVDLHFNPLGR